MTGFLRRNRAHRADQAGREAIRPDPLRQFAAWLVRALAAAFALAFALSPAVAAAQAPVVLSVRIDGIITPVVSEILTDALAEAEASGAEALLVELNTPGGLDTSMREIIQSFLGANAPVIVYVSPSGGRAASAGALITFSAHVAAMAPGTTIGAATPVNANTGEKASDKVINDAAAYAESVAAQRGRNTEFAVATVREGKAVAADEAVSIGAVDLLSPDRSALLQTVDGRTVSLANGSVATLSTANAQVADFEIGFMRRLLQVIADPNLAFLFLSVGTLAVIYEAATPGMGLGGVVGVILLVLGFFALSVLPVNIAGVALLVLAAALFLAEVFTPGIGVYAVGGSLSLAMAGLFLFQGPAAVRVSPAVFIPTAAFIGLGSLLAGRLAWKARRLPPVSGASTLLGRSATAGPRSTVLLDGSWWSARSTDGELTPGQRVRVVDRDGLTLIVEPEESQGGPDG